MFLGSLSGLCPTGSRTGATQRMYPAHSVCRKPAAHGVCRIHGKGPGRKRGQSPIAGDRVRRQTVIEAMEPVPIFGSGAGTRQEVWEKDDRCFSEASRDFVPPVQEPVPPNGGAFSRGRARAEAVAPGAVHLTHSMAAENMEFGEWPSHAS
jgi:hypothetical protein